MTLFLQNLALDNMLTGYFTGKTSSVPVGFVSAMKEVLQLAQRNHLSPLMTAKLIEDCVVSAE